MNFLNKIIMEANGIWGCEKTIILNIYMYIDSKIHVKRLLSMKKENIYIHDSCKKK